jgi:hypothetical protein
MLGVAFLAACSDSPTAPTAANVMVPKSSFAVGAVTPTPAPTAVTGRIVVCKTGNAGGSFSFTRTTEGPNIVSSTFVGTGPITIATGTCLEVADDDSPSGSGSHITVTEAPAANTVQTITACSFRGYQLDGVTLNPPVACTYVNGGDLFLNHFHGYVITYNNVFTPPSTGCTFTKGWYRNNGSSTVTAVDGRTKSEAQTIFAATPGKPLGVTWGDDNNNLNLYQQLLAALQNLGGDAHALDGPPALDAAITAALGATSGSGRNIIVAPGTDVGGLISVLSSFNEGTLAGGPAHCGDEVL